MNTIISLYGKAFFYTPGVVVAFLGFYSLFTTAGLDFYASSMWLMEQIGKAQDQNIDMVAVYMATTFSIGSFMSVIHIGSVITEGLSISGRPSFVSRGTADKQDTKV